MRRQVDWIFSRPSALFSPLRPPPGGTSRPLSSGVRVIRSQAPFFSAPRTLAYSACNVSQGAFAAYPRSYLPPVFHDPLTHAPSLLGGEARYEPKEGACPLINRKRSAQRGEATPCKTAFKARNHDGVAVVVPDSSQNRAQALFPEYPA